MSSIRRSLAFSFGQTYGVYILNLIGTFVVARLLTPSDFGVYAIGTSVALLLDAVRDFGVGTFIVQERSLERDRVRSAVTVAFGVSVLSALILLVVAEPVAALYVNPGVAAVLYVLAANFIVSVIGVASQALLRRDLRFDILATINLSSAVVQLFVLMSLALLGFGYMSFAWSVLAASLVRSTGSLVWCPVPWAFRPSVVAWREIISFGGISTSMAAMNVLQEALPQLIIGRILGIVPVGLYGRATTVCSLPDRVFGSALAPVILPALTERVRADRDLKTPYLLSLSYMSALLWPGLLCLVLLADPVVGLLLGAQWEEVPSLVRIMAMGSLSLFPAFMTYPMLVALGRIRDTLVISLVSLPPSILLVLALSHAGIYAVAAAQLINAPLQAYVAVSFIRRRLDLSWREISEAVRPSAIVALCAAGPVAAVIALAGWRFELPLPLFFVAACAAAGGWLCGVAIGGHPFLHELRRLRSSIAGLAGP